jgi:Flp pilus assembly protein CpaB
MLFMLCGLLLALVAALMVRNASQRAQAEAAQRAQPVYVVMATEDVPEFVPVPASAVAIKAFPSAYAPQGAAVRVEDVVGKRTMTRLTRDQVVLSSQVATNAGPTSPSTAVPVGKVAIWMPVPDLLGQSGGLQVGDHVDILLTVTLAGTGANANRGLTTQTTVQNAEVLFVGLASAPPPAQGQQNQQPQQPNPSNPNAISSPGAKVMAVAVDPQEAVVAKYIKDAGGNIDLVLRSRNWTDVVNTESINADSLVDRYRFRVPDRWTASR